MIKENWSAVLKLLSVQNGDWTINSIKQSVKNKSVATCVTLQIFGQVKKTVTHKNDNRPSQDMTLHLHSKMCLSKSKELIRTLRKTIGDPHSPHRTPLNMKSHNRILTTVDRETNDSVWSGLCQHWAKIQC